MANYYASPTGASGNSGTLASPWDLQTALSNASQGSGDTLWLRDGVYYGKFISTLEGGTVRSYTGEWAVLNGDKTTTLNGGINDTTLVLTVASTAGMRHALSIVIDTETMTIDTIDSATQITLASRGGGLSGAVSHSNGATVRWMENQLHVDGGDTTYRDFEVCNSYTQRDLEPGAMDGTQGCCGFYSQIRGAGISQYIHSGNSYINLFVQDNLDVFFIGSGTSNSLLY
jgi:hypothetical protein